jgi:hypothetical protein
MPEWHLTILPKWYWLKNAPRNFRRFRQLPRIKPGDCFVDCGWHPVVATEAYMVRFMGVPYDWDLAGVSLLDGSTPRACSAKHCNPQPIDLGTTELLVGLMISHPAWRERDPERALDGQLALQKSAQDHILRIFQQSPDLQQVWEQKS